MKRYTFRCFLQHCKVLIAIALILLLSSLLSFKIAEFACWLRQCDCFRILHQEAIITRSQIPHYHRHKNSESGDDDCLSTKRNINMILSEVSVELQCDMLTGLPTKTENQCLQEEAQAFQLFQENQVYQRLDLEPPAYFKAFKTVAFKKPTKYEIETPLGFAILVHNQIGQFEALMGSLFRPQNSYCIYVDQKTSDEFKGQVETIIGNYKAMFPQANIFMANDTKPIYWGDPSMLNADLACMRQLLTSSLSLKRTNPEARLWKYYLNLAGTAMPQTDVQQMARILSDFDGNDSIESGRRRMDVFEKRFKFVHYMPAENKEEMLETNFEAKNDDYLHKYAVSPRTDFAPKDPPPFNLTIFKGYREAIISRETAMFMTTSKLATEFHSWLQDGAMSEEFFFATMARVIQKEYREAGNVVQDLSENADTQNGLCNRLSLWSSYNLPCKGVYKRWICNLALPDLATAFYKQQCFFINKFDLKVDPLPVSCLYQHWTESDYQTLEMQKV